MLVKVVDLMPNPYRNLERYPIDRQKVDDLKSSINETSFWDNLIARPSPIEPGKYEIAYGHHRILALHELSVEEVNIPIKDFNDVTMLKIMANENMTAWAATPSVVNETVLAVKNYLNEELTKCEKFEDVKNLHLIDLLDVRDDRQYRSLRKRGVGQTIILKFLGGSWKQWMIQEALAAIKQEEEGVLDREAAEQFETVAQAQEFRKEVVEKGVPVEKQKVIAQQVVKSKPKATEVSTRVEQAAAAITPQILSDLQEEPVEEEQTGFQSISEVVEALEDVQPPDISTVETFAESAPERLDPSTEKVEVKVDSVDLVKYVKDTTKMVSRTNYNLTRVEPYLSYLEASFWRGEFYFEVNNLLQILTRIMETYEPQEANHEQPQGDTVTVE